MIRRIAHKARQVAKREINLFRFSQSEGRARAISDSLKAALRQRKSQEEKRQIERIEDLRRELETSPAEIAKVDYGAGSMANGQEGLRSQEEMSQGVEVKRTVGEITKVTSKGPLGAFVLFRLIRGMKPSSAIEMGTSVGISAGYQAIALQLNGHGKLTTLEGASTVAEVARENLNKLGLANAVVVAGRFQETLEEVLRREQPIDYVFVDGHHDGKATLEYFELVCQYTSDGAVLVFDDISWSGDMRQAWEDIIASPKVYTSVDLGSMGICLVGKGREQKYEIPLL